MVGSIIIGAVVEVDIIITIKKADEKWDISGSLNVASDDGSNGASKFVKKLKKLSGMIKGSVKADLKSLDSNRNKNIEKTINIWTKPMSLLPTNATSIESLLNMLDDIQNKLAAETHFSHISADIKGVPVSFLLVPLKQYQPNAEIQRLYISLEKEMIEHLMNTFLELEKYLIGFMNHGLLEREPKLLHILNDPTNELTQRVRERDEILKKTASSFKGTLTKNLWNTNTGLKSILSSCSTSINPNSIHRKSRKNC